MRKSVKRLETIEQEIKNECKVTSKHKLSKELLCKLKKHYECDDILQYLVQRKTYINIYKKYLPLLENYSIKSFKATNLQNHPVCGFILLGNVTNMKHILTLFYLLNHNLVSYNLISKLRYYKNNCVLLCQTEEKRSTLTILPRTWYDYWHNPKWNKYPYYPTYNCIRETDTVIRKLVKYEEIETIISDKL